MATQDRRPPPQPAEERQGAHRIPHHDNPAECIRHAEEEAEEERAYGGVGELPDGDGVRSDLGTNPLPECYWDAYPDKGPDER